MHTDHWFLWFIQRNTSRRRTFGLTHVQVEQKSPTALTRGLIMFTKWILGRMKKSQEKTHSPSFQRVNKVTTRSGFTNAFIPDDRHNTAIWMRCNYSLWLTPCWILILYTFTFLFQNPVYTIQYSTIIVFQSLQGIRVLCSPAIVRHSCFVSWVKIKTIKVLSKLFPHFRE